MDDGSSPLFRLGLFIVFIVINAVVYGFSAAVQSINQVNIQKQANEGSGISKKIIAIIDNPYKFINTIQVISTLIAMLAGIFELNVVVRFLRNSSKGIVGKLADSMAFGILVYLIGALFIIFILLSAGVLVPKKLGAKYPEKWAFSLVNIVYALMVLFTPVTFMISFVTNIILRICGVDPYEEDDNVTEEDIVSVVNEGHEQGVLLDSEAAMINNIVEFGDKESKDIMTHRKNLISVDGNWTLNQTIRFILNENKSRFPVYIGDIDNIVGILHLKDVAKAHEKTYLKNRKIKDIHNLFRKTLFIPETRKINVLFKDMQYEKIHMAVVLDEYGQTSGIVAMEDILEEIVGNILDEYDEDENNIVRQKDNSYIVKGMTPLDELEKVINIKFDEEEYDTLNGFLITKLNRIPADDERTEIVTDECIYKILSVENKMISLVQIKLKDINQKLDNGQSDDGQKNNKSEKQIEKEH